MLLKLIFVAVLFATVSFGGKVHVENLCRNAKNGRIVALQITDCNKLPCTFVRNKEYNIALTYTPGQNGDIQRIQCGSVVLGRPQIIADFNLCEEFTKENRCPVVAGQQYTYNTTVKITPPAAGKYNVWCDVMNETGFKELCLQGDARIQFWAE